MMQNQRRISKPTLPFSSSSLDVSKNTFEHVERRKDKLFNDLLRLVEQKGLKFSTGQLDSGKSYLITVTSTLWYIDHHESTIMDRGCEIPAAACP